MNTHREIVTNKDIKSTGFLSFLKSVEREADKTKVMDMLRIFSNVCVTLRNNRLPFPLQKCNQPTKRQKVIVPESHYESQPLRDIRYIQTLSKGTFSIKSLLSQHIPVISGSIIVGKHNIDNINNANTNSNSNTNRRLSNIDFGHFHQYFTPIGKDLFIQ